MRKFTVSTIIFTLIVFIIIISLIEFSEYIISENLTFKLKNKNKNIILGHSHAECAFNDIIIENFKNVSKSGEAYFYTFFKIRKLIEDNSSIKVVYIEFTNNQINYSMNNWIWKEKYLYENYPTYSSLMDINDKEILARKNLIGLVNSMSISLKKNIFNIINKKYNPNIGGYLKLEKNKTDSLIKIEKTNVIKKDKLSKFNIRYLIKIINYCKDQNIKVILIRSPQHKKYSGYSNEIKYQEILKTHFSTIEYIDFSEFPLQNSEFADLEHLNFKGAQKFSYWFNNFIKKEFPINYDKQIFVNKQIIELKNNK